MCISALLQKLQICRGLWTYFVRKSVSLSKICQQALFKFFTKVDSFFTGEVVSTMVVNALPTAPGKLYSSTLFYAHKESLVYGFEVSHPHIMCSSSKRETGETQRNVVKIKNSEEKRSLS